MMRRAVWMCVNVLIVLMIAESARAQTAAPVKQRRVFVLHSGMHFILASGGDKNGAAITLKQMLSKRGIPERDLIVMDSPFPTASWRDIAPRAGLVIFLESTDPKSRSCSDAYLCLHKALQTNHVTPNDDIVWIGHSAGGQIGMSMAHLGHNLKNYPPLDTLAKPYRFKMVITLGTAVGSNPVPDHVKLRHYHSPADLMVQALSKQGNFVTDAMNSKVCFQVCRDMRGDSLVRVFPAVEHSYWYLDELVLNRILGEFEPNHCPAWRRTQADLPQCVGLAQLIAQTLESEWKITLEEAQH